jgi:Flp pilus assembly pilin Flp
MLKLYVQFKSLVDDEKGQTVIEYALIVILVALASVAGYKALASAVSTGLTGIAGQLTAS